GADVTTVSFPGETDTDYDYDWTVPDGSIVKTGDVDVLTARKDGAYSVVATSQLTGCSSAPVAGTITAPVLPVPVVDTQASTNCTGGAKNGEVFVTLPFQDPLVYAYSWFDGPTATGAVKSTVDRYTGLQGGSSSIFTVELTERLTGCSGVASAVLGDDSKLPNAINLGSTPDTFCTVSAGTGTATLNNFNYRGNTISSFDDFVITWTGRPADLTPVITGLDAGTYTIRVTHKSDNCVSDAATVVVGTNFTFPPVVTTIVTPQTSCAPGILLGKLGANVGGATSGYTFVWRTGSNFSTGTGIASADDPTNTSNNTTPGLPGGAFYVVRGTETLTGCSSDVPVFLPDDRIFPGVSLITTANSSCIAPDGSVSATISTNYESAATYDYYFLKEQSGVTTLASAVITKVTNTPGQFDKKDAALGQTDAITAVPYGTYTVVVENNITKCKSQPVAEEVKDLRGNFVSINVD
ncbi:MAG: hypothetical protein ACKOAR_05260, partial [Bacteroidota bacterium]